ncbi:hypothetical protein OG818_30345 [Streptomyces virginiae]|uniref:hypothetical protein n=1 Tax=Streptomyces virginiae TaxID=1961 RepID=UPI0022558647|nr:hypothetical protein [Streptomyces virginiae]MCX4720026.1 hypothetical protein [Streptomyces virginiae]
MWTSRRLRPRSAHGRGGGERPRCRGSLSGAAGLTLDWSSGSIEGAVNRIKKIKRQLYGRAGFELLRKMILLQ